MSAMESELIQFSAAAAFPPAGCHMPPLTSAAASSINELFIKNKFLEGETDISVYEISNSRPILCKTTENSTCYRYYFRFCTEKI